VANQLQTGSLHLIGLGCGGGQKDVLLLKLLTGSQNDLFYTPSDVSSAMVLKAHKAATEIISKQNCCPLVVDLAIADDLQSILENHSFPHAPRVLTFFGMLPNFESQSILAKLAELIRPGEHLLLSANLAPGPDYAKGVKQVLPLYDNELTREWLITFLLDSGFERGDGQIRFVIEDDPANTGLKRIVAHFQLERNREIEIESEKFTFSPGESIRLFFSYRHTSSLVDSLLTANGLILLDQWMTSSQEEGVFLVTRKSP
jgi:uncharacterized SAM-dependent methyltransferase